MPQGVCFFGDSDFTYWNQLEVDMRAISGAPLPCPALRPTPLLWL